MRPRQGHILALAVAVPGFVFVGFAFTGTAGAACALAAIDGASAAVLDVLIVTSLQRLLGNDLLGRAFGAVDSLYMAAMLAGSVVAVPLVTDLGLDAALVIGGVVVIAAAGLVFTRARALDRRAAARAEQLGPLVEVLAGLGLFEASSRATLEGLAELVSEETVAAGTVVIREGAAPDDLFVAIGGHLAVTTEARGRVGSLAAGDYFGELGLLHDVPRIATVTAEVACTLWRIPGAAFLRLVSEEALWSSGLTHRVQSRIAATRPEHPREIRD
jgi:hypothetical protein